MSKLITGSLALSILIALPAIATDSTLVRHRDVIVTDADFDAYMERVPQEHRLEARASDERNNKVVDILFTNRMLARDARAAGLDKDPVIARRLEQHIEAFLATQYVTSLERNVAIPANLENRVRELYIADSKRFIEPDRMDLQHILITFNARTREMARELAAQIRAKALASEDFLVLAKQYSEDPGFKRDGGRLGLVAAKDIEEGLAMAAFRLKANGELTEPIETRNGYHLLKRVGFMPSFKRTFEEVKEQLIEAEMSKIRSESSLKLLDAYRRSPETEWNIPGIAALRTETPRDEIARKQREELERMKREAQERAQQSKASPGASPAQR